MPDAEAATAAGPIAQMRHNETDARLQVRRQHALLLRRKSLRCDNITQNQADASSWLEVLNDFEGKSG
jgi:hypothetical protein